MILASLQGPLTGSKRGLETDKQQWLGSIEGKLQPLGAGQPTTLTAATHIQIPNSRAGQHTAPSPSKALNLPNDDRYACETQTQLLCYTAFGQLGLHSGDRAVQTFLPHSPRAGIG